MRRLALPLLVLVVSATGCTMPTLQEVPGPPRKENVFAVTEGGKLISFNAGQPQKVASVGAVTGLEGNENLVGIDFRVARGILYGLGSTGRLYTIDTRTAAAKPVGAGVPIAMPLSGTEFGFDFNPIVDRIRVVSNTGQNFRIHPDTGAMVDGNPNEDGIQPDGAIAWAPGDPDTENMTGKKPRLAAAAYTYNKQDAKITTNYAIDAGNGLLVTQGTKEGVTPAVSPNTGRLYIVGSLGLSAFSQVGFDIADASGAAFISASFGAASRFYLVDLATGSAKLIGTIGGGERVRGISIEP